MRARAADEDEDDEEEKRLFWRRPLSSLLPFLLPLPLNAVDAKSGAVAVASAPLRPLPLGVGQEAFFLVAEAMERDAKGVSECDVDGVDVDGDGGATDGRRRSRWRRLEDEEGSSTTASKTKQPPRRPPSTRLSNFKSLCEVNSERKPPLRPLKHGGSRAVVSALVLLHIFFFKTGNEAEGKNDEEKIAFLCIFFLPLDRLIAEILKKNNGGIRRRRIERL